MDNFDFLIGDWDLEYRIPKGGSSDKKAGIGLGTFKRALNNKYVFFDLAIQV